MDAQNPDPTQVAHIMAAVMPIMGLFFLLFQALIIVPLWVAFKKAGLAPALSLISLVPLGLFVVLFILAFSTWKVTPAPQYTGTYPGQIPPPAYPPVYPQGGSVPPSATSFSAPGAYTPQPPAAPPSAYPPPPTDPQNRY
ncbi:hypothetical protein [Terriglobus aquaticus]|uniref:Uncharacterized protein n=1 Tax=Terriglobus aquaticus TaxID=940139 RepID=A0ABW9KMF0_9BACT|nr:hypothetical protein [Terriglobus aquaticus]